MLQHIAISDQTPDLRRYAVQCPYGLYVKRRLYLKLLCQRHSSGTRTESRRLRQSDRYTVYREFRSAAARLHCQAVFSSSPTRKRNVGTQRVPPTGGPTTQLSYPGIGIPGPTNRGCAPWGQSRKAPNYSTSRYRTRKGRCAARRDLLRPHRGPERRREHLVEMAEVDGPGG